MAANRERSRILSGEVMTRAEFEAFLWPAHGPTVPIYIRPPFDIVPCDCGDVNCHGWRLVEPQRREVS
jgi:hypothetical protein